MINSLGFLLPHVSQTGYCRSWKPENDNEYRVLTDLRKVCSLNGPGKRQPVQMKTFINNCFTPAKHHRKNFTSPSLTQTNIHNQHNGKHKLHLCKTVRRYQNSIPTSTLTIQGGGRKGLVEAGTFKPTKQ